MILGKQDFEFPPQTLTGKAIEDSFVNRGRHQVSGVRGDGEIESAGVSHGADGAGRVVDERQRVQNADVASLKILPAAEKIDEFAVVLTVERDRQ